MTPRTSMDGQARRGARPWAGLFALGLAAALLAGCGSEGDPVRSVTAPASGPPLLVAFCSDRPPSPIPNKDIYFYNAQTQKPAWMPPNVDTYYDEGPLALSGDGHTMVYSTTNPLVGTGTKLLIYDTRTGIIRVPQSTVQFGSPVNPSLSYDGHYMAFQNLVGSFLELYIVMVDVPADTIIPTPKLHLLGAQDFDPSLSGDGKLIAFASNRTGGYDVYLYDVARDSVIALPGMNSSSSDLAPSISADGRYIAFHSNRPGGVGLFDVYVYDRQAQQFLPLPGANTTLSDINPALSPDGRYLAFSTESEGGTDIRLYDLVAQKLVSAPGLNDPYFADRFPALSNLP